MFAACVITHTGSPAPLAQRGTALVAQGRVAEARTPTVRPSRTPATGRAGPIFPPWRSGWSSTRRRWSTQARDRAGARPDRCLGQRGDRQLAAGERRDAAKAMQHAHRLAPPIIGGDGHGADAACSRPPAAAPTCWRPRSPSGGPGFALRHAMGELMRVMERPPRPGGMRATRCDRSRTTRSRMWCAAVRARMDDKRQDPGVWRAVLVDCLSRLQAIAAGTLPGRRRGAHACDPWWPVGSAWDIDIAIDADVPGMRCSLRSPKATGLRPARATHTPVGEIGVLGLVHVDRNSRGRPAPAPAWALGQVLRSAGSPGVRHAGLRDRGRRLRPARRDRPDAGPGGRIPGVDLWRRLARGAPIAGGQR